LIIRNIYTVQVQTRNAVRDESLEHLLKKEVKISIELPSSGSVQVRWSHRFWRSL